MRIPERIFIRDECWRVEWRAHDDPFWTAQPRLGCTIFDDRLICLDERLRHAPGLLREVWIHELLHACLPRTRKGGRPKGFTDKMEEDVVESIDAALALCLNQCGWDVVDGG